jgi:hypothetical protein
MEMQFTNEMMLFAVAIQIDEIDCSNFIHSRFLVYMPSLDEDVNQLYIH